METIPAPMELRPGAKLGPYEIVCAIGEGGMGEVWKARDTRLDRDVAMKVSKTEFSDRFEREARTVAAFNHPNICQLHDVGPNYLVMELIDGVPLKGPLPVEKAVEYAGQILDALDAAHRKGIVHRDLKPPNILVTKQGIKLLDFGLAKRNSVIQESDATRTAAITQEGQIAGTLQYMAPEQLQGKEADARSDIFSFGCVLYEMLSGERAFSGPSAASVIAGILEREAEPLQTTPAVDRVIRTCLAKDPDRRFQTAIDLKRNLIWAMETNAVASPNKVRTPWVVAAAGVLIAIAVSVFHFAAVTPAAHETRLDIVTPATSSPTSFALSPDARRIAYVASADGPSRLWVRPFDSTLAQPLPGTEGAINPFWSPDSRSLGFFADQKLKRIDLGGGQPQTLAGVLNLTAQGTWSPGGVILFTPGGAAPLVRIPASGGPAEAATKLGKGQTFHRTPRFLPGGRQFLFYATGEDQSLWLGSLDGAEPRHITAIAPGTDSAAEYLAPGWLVRVRQGALVAQHFDAGSGQLSGEPVPLARGVSVDSTTQAGSFSVSPGGTIAWRGGGGGRRQLIWFNRSGENAGAFGAPDEANLLHPELSPDGKRAAITRGPVGSGDIWMQEGTRTSRFTFDPTDDRWPIWSPDGARVAFSSRRKGPLNLYHKPATASGNEELLLQSADNKAPNSWSPDKRFILYWSSQNNGDLMVLPLTGERKPFPFVSTPFSEIQGAFSPDGKWVAYQSNESGRYEIYVRPFPGPGGQWQVSTGGGISPRWRADGKELYYLAPDAKLMAVAVAAKGATFAPGTPEALFPTHITPGIFKQQYDVGRDGRFLINTELETASTEPIHLLLNWKPPGK
ncbi:MAG: serine/threonine protein kinase [Bryobacterales bacterium]|nr:serine/threonine protein kinase [Bryobacterales bacterium]